ncbi:MULTISPECIES: hypothetical protein [Acinetobacter]|uniref:Uncharacterized protein n=1 Tax=Acinetobacter pollinis TaxID=2605270 RepID=A0ABU6DRK5_9GAMM|nr:MULTISPECIES: hypothetical protein [Acinetobacter]MBF7689245.1 hypothetical protein [Acinetobacter pollinis]MBF7691908.1 hypothetical protein [Acinetobacter pollinis]MBF7696790.1 hypothetical protein [Acinetobacter pollinis]MBF7700013.1 hypothetical protein [Acinetobacter pollinis]MEB5476465.1 hypothetical protein [Acinetobacter pollinis]
MKHINMNELFAKASELPMIRHGRMYQHDVFVKLNEKAHHAMHQIPEKIKLSIPSISIGVFDGEFEEHHTLLEQMKKINVQKVMRNKYRQFFH